MKAARSPAAAKKVPQTKRRQILALGFEPCPDPSAHKTGKKCRICGKDVPPRKKGRRGRGRHAYCSDACAEVAQKIQMAKAREKRKKATGTKVRIACAVCGKKFWPERSTSKYCKDKCREIGQELIVQAWKEKRKKERKARKK